MVVCCFPVIREQFIKEGSYLKIVVIEPLMEIGKVYSVFILIFLGCNIYLLDKETALIRNRSIVLISVNKLVICPILGVGVIRQMMKYGLCISDPLLVFVYWMNYCAPTAINLLTIANTYSQVGDDMAKLLLFQYICYLLILPFLLTLFLFHYS